MGNIISYSVQPTKLEERCLSWKPCDPNVTTAYKWREDISDFANGYNLVIKEINQSEGCILIAGSLYWKKKKGPTENSPVLWHLLSSSIHLLAFVFDRLINSLFLKLLHTCWKELLCWLVLVLESTNWKQNTIQQIGFRDDYGVCFSTRSLIRL